MRSLLPFVFLVSSFVAVAQKKPVTIDAVVSQPANRSGFGTIHWAPDGKRFAWSEAEAVWIYDVVSARRRQLIAIKQLEKKAIKPPAPQTFGWQNRRVAEQAIQWFPSGNQI